MPLLKQPFAQACGSNPVVHCACAWLAGTMWLTLLVLTCYVACVLSGGPFVRLGASTELPNHFAAVRAPATDWQPPASAGGVGSGAVRRFRKQEIQTAEAEIRAAISPNGLALNDETLRDGNCGLDAIIRTIAEVPPESRPAVAAELMHVLEKHGRVAALK